MTLATVVKPSRAVSILTAVLLSVISTGASAQVADLTIVKTSRPANDTPFPFFVVAPSNDTTFFTLQDPSDPDTTFLDLPVGTYEIWETLPKFWALAVVEGAAGGINAPNDSLRGTSITLAEDDSLTVRLINANFGLEVIKTDMLIHDELTPNVADGGDSLKFTIRLIETEDPPANLSGVIFELNDSPDPSTTLVWGTVTIMNSFALTAILDGNDTNDTSVRVQGAVPVGDTTTITYKAVVNDDFPPASQFCNQAVVEGILTTRNMPDVPSDDPDDPTSAEDETCVPAGQTNLPVELSTFDSHVDAQVVVLTWTTLSETNNAGFSIEMRESAETVFAKVGYVEGRGTTLEPQSYRFVMDGLEPGRYDFRLKQIDFDGAFKYSSPVQASIEVIGSFYLSEAYPNPFNPTTTLRLGVPADQLVRVDVFDALGKRAATLHDDVIRANEVKELHFDAKTLPSGLYFVRATGAAFAATRTALLMK